MKAWKTFLILAVLVIVVLLPVIPAYYIGGPHFRGTMTENGPIVGFGGGQCVGQLLVSMFYLLTGLGPKIVLKAPTQCL